MANILYCDTEKSYFLCAGHDLYQPMRHQNIYQRPFLISMQWAWGDGEVQSICSDGKDDLRVVKKAALLFEKADYVIMHNGDRFDWPSILDRMIYHRLPPISEPVFVDTLKMARKLKAPSRSLDYLTYNYELVRKQKPEQGDWLEASLKGNKAAIKRIEKYGMGDIPTLRSLYHTLAPYVKNKVNMGIGAERPCCTNCGSVNVNKEKSRRTATGLKQQWHCQDCGKYMTTGATTGKSFFK